MQIVTKAILLFVTYFIAITSAFASPGVNQITQQISTECQFLDIAAGPNPSLQDQIRDLCSAWNPGTNITPSNGTGVRIRQNAVTLSDVATSGLPRNNRGSRAVGGPKVSANSEINRRGLNAGGMYSNISVWGSFNYNNLDDDFFNTTYDSDTRSFLVGADIQPQENMVAGLALGYEDADVDTLFNSGEQERDGFTIAGYFGYLINNNLSIDASAGYTAVEYEQFRMATFADPNFGAAVGSKISSEVDADRFFIAGNVNGFWVLNNWMLGANAGLVWGEEDQDNFTESAGGISAGFTGQDFETGLLRIGGNVAYDNQSGFSPYFGLEYLNEFEREDIRLSPGLLQHKNDEDEFLFTVGIRYFGNQTFSGDFNFNVSTGRDNIDNSNLMLMLRAEL
jgi:autotransporter-like protein